MFRTRFTDVFDLTYPIMSAPMSYHVGATLVSAVSNAGGMGSFGGLNAHGPEWIGTEVSTIRSITERPFAIGFITPVLSYGVELFEAALAERPPAVILSFSDPNPWVSQAKSVGAKVICQVQDYADADQAVDAGADILVAQGTGAGGHTGSMSLLPLLTGIVTRHPDIPVLAAGGIADGRALAAALCAGADGAMLGTAFLATAEAVEVPDLHKRLITESDGADTVLTRIYDIVLDTPFPPKIVTRVRRNKFTDKWADHETELRERRGELDLSAFGKPPLEGGDPFAAPDRETSPILYGQGAGFIDSVRPAADVISTICEQAEVVLRSRPGSILLS